MLTIFENINEEGVVYFWETVDKLPLGIDLLQTYPNDTIVIRVVDQWHNDCESCGSVSGFHYNDYCSK